MEDVSVRERVGRQEEKAPEGEEKGGYTHIIYQTMAAASVGLGNLGAAVAMGYTSPALPSMHADPDFNITKENESWIGSVMPAAALVGSLIAGPLVDRLGRRNTLLHLVWPWFLSWMAIAMAGEVSGVMVGRVLGGVCVGMQAVVSSVFMPEIIHLDLRNVLAAFPAFLGNLGLLVSYAAGQFLSWRGLAWLGASLSFLPVLLLLPLPETPHHLTHTGRPEASLAALRLLRHSTREAKKEQQEINDSIKKKSESQKEVSIMELVHTPNLWPVGVSACLMMAQQTTGITAVLFFASTILKAGGEAMAGKASVVLAVVNFIGTLVGIYFVGKSKRRDMLRRSSRIVVPALLVLSFFFWAQDAGGSMAALASTLYMVPVVALVAYMLGFSIGWGPVPWVFVGEGIPSWVRGKAAATVVAINWGFAFLVTKSFGWSLAVLGNSATFLGYAVLTTVSATLILGTMPETFKQSTAQMDQLYRDTAAKKQQ